MIPDDDAQFRGCALEEPYNSRLCLYHYLCMVVANYYWMGHVFEHVDDYLRSDTGSNLPTDCGKNNAD